ncbi:MAG: hypothetical protein WCT48_05810 [Candidatus Paceibacterota bacterium]
MDEDKIPQKGILGNKRLVAPNSDVIFDVPQKQQMPATVSSDGITFDAPQNQQVATVGGEISAFALQKQTSPIVPRKSDKDRLPITNKTLEPTADLTDFPTLNIPDDITINSGDIPNIPLAPLPSDGNILGKSSPAMTEKPPAPIPLGIKKPEDIPKVTGLLTNKEPDKKTITNLPSDIPTLRTYKKDVADAIKDQKTSLVRMVLEEQKVRLKRELEESPRSRKNIPLILLSVVFFLATAGIIYYSFFRPSANELLLAEIKVTPLINTEAMQEFLVDGKSAKVIAKEISQELITAKPRLDTIKAFFFTETFLTQTENGPVQQKKLVSAKDLFQKLEIPVPQVILRTIKSEFLYGYHTFNGNAPFLILKTDYYDNAFVGMLEWEKDLSRNLKPLFGTISTENLSGRTWSDVVTKNKDTRVLYNFDNSIALVYMFKDQRTLIITTNNSTLFEISRRLDLSLKKK